MNRRPLPIMLTLLAMLLLAVGACSDDDGDADPTPAGIGDEDTNATVPRDDDGAIGEAGDEDSQTDTTRPGAPVDEETPNDDSDTFEARGSGDDVVPTSNRARVLGPFGDQDVDLLLTENARCAIDDAPDAGDEAGAEVVGATADGEAFALDWSVDDGVLEAELELEGTTWTVNADLDDEGGERTIRLTRTGEVLMETTFRSDTGETAEAQLFVNCQPVT